MWKGTTKMKAYTIVVYVIITVQLQLITAFQFQHPTTRVYYYARRVSVTQLLQSNNNMDSSEEDSSKTIIDTSDSGFGASVPYVPLSQRSSNNLQQDIESLPSVSMVSSASSSSSAPTTTIDETQLLKQSRTRNIIIAIASFTIAIFNYLWQFTHPITAIEILTQMDKQSAPLTSIGNNGKPTVIDFWAPWCGNCKVAAPTLQAIEEEYGDKVNFIMVNADEQSYQNGALISIFSVDSIPHLALLSDEGDVETALIGPMSRNVLRADIDALLSKKEDCGVAAAPVDEVKKVEDVVVPYGVPSSSTQVAMCHDELPYKMYDAFGNKPGRRLNFAER